MIHNDNLPVECDTVFGRFGLGKARFNDPTDVVIDGNDNILVLDSGNKRVQVLNEEGDYKSEWSLRSVYRDQRSDFSAIALSPKDGSVYVLDRGDRRVHKFSAEGKYLLSFGKYGLGKGKLEIPVDLCVDRQGYVYVLDQRRLKVLKWHENGIFVVEWGGEGGGSRQFEKPESITFMDVLLGSVAVLDMEKRSILQFDTKGEYETSFDLSIPLANAGGGNSRLRTDSSGNLFILEASRGKLIKIDLRTTVIFLLDQTGTQAENMHGLAIDSDGRLYVSDLGRDRIFRFSINQ